MKYVHQWVEKGLILIMNSKKSNMGIVWFHFLKLLLRTVFEIMENTILMFSELVFYMFFVFFKKK